MIELGRYHSWCQVCNPFIQTKQSENPALIHEVNTPRIQHVGDVNALTALPAPAPQLLHAGTDRVHSAGSSDHRTGSVHQQEIPFDDHQTYIRRACGRHEPRPGRVCSGHRGRSRSGRRAARRGRRPACPERGTRGQTRCPGRDLARFLPHRGDPGHRP